MDQLTDNSAIYCRSLRTVNYNFIVLYGCLIGRVSACLTTNQVIASSIPGTSAVLKLDWIWDRVHPAT